MKSSDIQALRHKRDELRERLAAIAADIGRGLDPDSEERAVQLENAEVLDEIARVTRIELQRIEASLQRIEREASPG